MPDTPARAVALLTQLSSDDPTRAESAFTTLYNKHHPKLLRITLRFGRQNDVPRAVCEDIVQDAMVQLWMMRATPPRPPVGAYLCAIAKRRVLNVRRDACTEDRSLHEFYARFGYTPFTDGDGAFVWGTSATDARVLRLEVYEAFASALNQMTPQRRGVLLDTYGDELSLAESAELRGVARETVKKLRYLGNRALVEFLTDAGHAPVSE